MRRHDHTREQGFTGHLDARRRTAGLAPAPAAAITWQSRLFPDLPAAVRNDIEVLLARALDAACPLKRTHRQELPLNILRLSRMLTVERARMRHPYWASPALTGAYVHYFLPWNVYRLARLFTGLKPEAPGEGAHMLLDLGSGPLTVPVALWLACPEWRDRKVVVAAVDSAGHPLQIGRRILEELARQAGVEPWEIHPLQAPLEQGVRRAMALAQKDVTPWLVTAANVLNELPPCKRQRLEEDEEDAHDDSRLSDILSGVRAFLRRGPQNARALFVEPGTRLGGLTLMRLRSLARDEDLLVTGPCPGQGACPLYRDDAASFEEAAFQDEDIVEDILGDGGALVSTGQVSRLAGRTWCHFTFTSDGAPSWLKALAEPTGLAKDSLSLAWLGLRARAAEEAEDVGRGMRLRVISGPFSVPGRGQCRYACSAAGLMLLENAGRIASGTDMRVSLTCGELAAAPDDARSGARCVAVRSDKPGSGGKNTHGTGHRRWSRKPR